MTYPGITNAAQRHAAARTFWLARQSRTRSRAWEAAIDPAAQSAAMQQQIAAQGHRDTCATLRGMRAMLHELFE